MLDEVLGRVATIESKAISVLGWATALLGFLLLRDPVPSSAGRWLLRATVLTTLVAVAAAAEAARARSWKWPGQRHWFCEELFDTPKRLRALHLTALLETYQVHTRVVGHKARALRTSQIAIVVAGVLVATAILLGVR